MPSAFCFLPSALTETPFSPRRNVYTAAAANGIGFAGFTIVMPFLPLYFGQLGVDDPGDVAIWSGVSLGVTPAITAAMSPFWARIADRVGRKLMVVRSLVSFVFIMSLMAFVAAPWQLIVLRFVIGAAIGADYPIATSLLTEFTPSKKRGVMVGMSAVAWSAGAAFAYVVGALFVGISGGNDHWRILLATSAVLGVIVILMRRGIPESPRWLLQNGRVADASAGIGQ